MLSDLDPQTASIRHYSVNACLTPLCSVFGKAVTTVEGVGNSKQLHAVQERAHGSQCGFCTPGFVMAFYALLRSNPKPSISEINEAVQGYVHSLQIEGNLCRCTGYRPILDAMYSFASPAKNCSKQCTLRRQPCKMNGDVGETNQVLPVAFFHSVQMPSKIQ
ncbi:unnamed protein product [Gongylonema pulchrum]|uniref:Fer2_2 domain-containing protein n=1 Tax=Gongylonema pulchrum TaxID=637853 RepID=A0A183D4M3_9BILA|nr:unnamed protein product [Gongylonema pulchrum]